MAYVNYGLMSPTTCLGQDGNCQLLHISVFLNDLYIICYTKDYKTTEDTK